MSRHGIQMRGGAVEITQTARAVLDHLALSFVSDRACQRACHVFSWPAFCSLRHNANGWSINRDNNNGPLQ